MPDPLDELREAARAALPPVEGELTVPGLREPVEVLRDRWGIPYLTATSQGDLWFAQGFVQASERLFQIDLALRAGTGRLSELFGELTLPADRFARTIGWNRIGEREARRWNEDSRAMVGAFVSGARAFVAQMPAPPLEYALLAAVPDLPEDLGPWASVFAYVGWGLSGNWDAELLRLRLRERYGDRLAEMLLPPLATDPPALAAGSLAGRLLDGIPRSRGQGSNSWVVAGTRTASGKPLLANDPHLLVGQPASWFEVHLRAPGYEARGVAFPFAPGIVIGTTAHHAWGITNVTGDVQDLYVERLSRDGLSAEFDGAWEPLTVRRERIDVRGADAVAIEVRETRHGPLLDAVPLGVAGDSFAPLEETVALRWTGADALLEPSALLDLVRAGSFEEFRQALRGLDCPGQNVVYADVDGTIGYQCSGRYPLRRAGDGSAPVPGWTSDHEWEGWLPFEDLPWAKDPSLGFLVTANNRIHDADYPHLIGLDFHTRFRAERVAELLEEHAGIGVADAVRMQVDTVSLPARRLLPRLLQATAATDAAAEALARLRDWDGDLRADSPEAAVYQTWIGTIAALVLDAEGDPETFAAYFAWREPFACAALPLLLEQDPPGGGSWNDLLGRALEEAVGSLRADLGDDPRAWRWGALHRVRFAHPLARLPIVDELFVAAEHELGGDEQTVLQAGVDTRLGFEAVVIPSWRVVVDLADLDRSVGVLTTGQSGNPVSPHWSDQAERWATGQTRPCPFSRPAVEAAAERSMTLRPG
ncbi:MAG TPA: penicillin acylase family protein [Actinomycetota bacterium]|nr:penicillin acylase family protein [Actinomycetota bacterium]